MHAPVLTGVSAQRLHLGLTILRVVLGIVFVMHGGQKLFVFGLDGVAGAFAQMGAPAPGLTGPLTAFVEFLGGLALIFGLLSRLAAAGLIVVMLGAIFIVHLEAGFFVPNGVEFPLTLAAGLAAVALIGPGQYSIDAVIGRRRSGGARFRA